VKRSWLSSSPIGRAIEAVGGSSSRAGRDVMCLVDVSDLHLDPITQRARQSDYAAQGVRHHVAHRMRRLAASPRRNGLVDLHGRSRIRFAVRAAPPPRLGSGPRVQPALTWWCRAGPRRSTRQVRAWRGTGLAPLARRVEAVLSGQMRDQSFRAPVGRPASPHHRRDRASEKIPKRLC
jgi:hypothetical protein